MSKLVTIREASEILEVHMNTLRKWDRIGYLKAVRFGPRGDRRYRMEDINRIKGEEGKITVDNNT